MIVELVSCEVVVLIVGIVVIESGVTSLFIIFIIIFLKPSICALWSTRLSSFSFTAVTRSSTCYFAAAAICFAIYSDRFLSDHSCDALAFALFSAQLSACSFDATAICSIKFFQLVLVLLWRLLDLLIVPFFSILNHFSTDNCNKLKWDCMDFNVIPVPEVN